MSSYERVYVPDADRQPSAVSGTNHVDLASLLGCTEMIPKVWFLDPGDEMSYHRQAEQEEFYYVLDGPARIRIGNPGTIETVETGTVFRIPPETPRQLLNDTDHAHTWLVIGAPPVPDDGRPVE